MVNIKVPPMIPLNELRERKKPYKLKAVDGVYAGAVFPIDDEIVFGRNAGEANILYPAEVEGVSRKHCSIKVGADGMVQIKDLGSTNGTYFADGTKLQANVAYRIHRGECFYLATKQETYKII